ALYNRQSKFLVDDTKRFFRVCQSDRELGDCLAYIRQMTTDHGGDGPEEPFEGVRFAVETYLKAPAETKGAAPPPHEAHHSPAASTTVLLVGDAPNHPKDPPGPRQLTKLDSNDVLELLHPIGDQRERVSRVMFHAIRVKNFASQSEDPEWDVQ